MKLKKNARKAVVLLLEISLLIGLASCRGSNTSGNNTNNGTNNSNVPLSGNSGNSNNVNNTPLPQPVQQDDHSDECIEAVSGKYKIVETILDQDPDVKHLYGWDSYKIDDETYLVAYAFDYDNNKKDDGYAIYGFECTCEKETVGEGENKEEKLNVKATPVSSPELYKKYEALGYELYQTYWPLEVNKGYFTDKIGLIDKNDEVLRGLAFFFRNLGVQPYLYITDEQTYNVTVSASQKYRELFTAEGGKLDGYHTLIYINKAADGNYAIKAASGGDALRLLGNNSERIIEDLFTRSWNKEENTLFSSVASEALTNSVISLYTCAYDKYYAGKEAEIPEKLVFVDVDEMSANDEYLPTITLVSDTEFKYNINMYEGMHEVGGSYYVVKDTNGNTVIECTIHDKSGSEENPSDYDGKIFDLVNLGGTDTWLYLGDSMGMTGDRSTFAASEDVKYIKTTLK